MLLQRIGNFFFRPDAPTVRPLEPRRPRARGTPDRGNPNSRRIVVTIDVATFGAIDRAAIAAGISQSEAIRQLIRRGLNLQEER